MYELVCARPGAHLREIARSLNLPLGTALYHLDYLRANEMVTIRRDGRYKRFFARDLVGRREKDYISVFHHTVPRKIVQALLAGAQRTQRELCREVGVSRSTLSFHVNNLVGKGVLGREERWPENVYYALEPETCARVLHDYAASFEDEAGADRLRDLVDMLRFESQEDAGNGPMAVQESKSSPLNAAH